MNRVLLAVVCSVAWLARRSPMSWSPVLDEIALDLMKYARFFKPMPRKVCAPGKPFVGKVRCEDMDCREEDMVIALNGLDPDADLVCGACGKDTAVLA